MSCKLLRDQSAHGLVSPLFQTPPHRTPEGRRRPAPWIPPGSGKAADESPSTPEGAEIERLRARVGQLEREWEQRAAEAFSAGQREGETQGYERAAAAARPVLEKLAGSIADLGQVRTRLREEAEHDLVRLSLAIARRVLRRELTVDPEALQGLVRAALERVQAREVTQVRLYPGHEEVVRRCLAACHAGGIELICDPALQPGDVVVETRRGNLDASVDTQLAEIERGFADRIRR